MQITRHSPYQLKKNLKINVYGNWKGNLTVVLLHFDMIRRAKGSQHLQTKWSHTQGVQILDKDTSNP